MSRGAEPPGLMLQTVLQAYRQGRGLSSRPAQAVLLGRFEQEARRQVIVRLSAEDIERFRRSVAPRERALRASRSGENAAAEQAMREARSALGLEQMSIEARLLMISIHQAAESYLDYREGRFEQSRTALLKALDATHALQGAHGYTFLEPRRIHLVRNLLHMEARRGRLDEALNLGVNLLSYLEGNTAAWPLPESQCTAAIPPMSDDMRAAAFDDVMESLAEVLAPETPETRRRLERFTPHLQPGASAACARFARPHQWLRLRWLAAQERDAEFLSEAHGFLAEGRGSTPSLWFAVVLELYRLSERLGAGFSVLREEFVRDAPTFQNVPKALRMD